MLAIAKSHAANESGNTAVAIAICLLQWAGRNAVAHHIALNSVKEAADAVLSTALVRAVAVRRVLRHLGAG